MGYLCWFTSLSLALILSTDLFAQEPDRGRQTLPQSGEHSAVESRPPIPVVIIEDADRAERAKTREEASDAREAADLAAQRTMAHGTDRLVAISWLQLYLSAAGAIGLFVSLGLNSVSVVAALKAAKVAGDQFEAQERSNRERTTSDLMEQSNRFFSAFEEWKWELMRCRDFLQGAGSQGRPVLGEGGQAQRVLEMLRQRMSPMIAPEATGSLVRHLDLRSAEALDSLRNEIRDRVEYLGRTWTKGPLEPNDKAFDLDSLRDSIENAADELRRVRALSLEKQALSSKS